MSLHRKHGRACTDDLSTAAAIADVLGLKKDCRKWTAMAERTRRAVHRTFYDKEDSSYCDGSMSNLTVALLADVPPTGCRQAVSERLENMILKDCSGHIDVGITGGAMLFMLLRAEGHNLGRRERSSGEERGH